MIIGGGGGVGRDDRIVYITGQTIQSSSNQMRLQCNSIF